MSQFDEPTRAGQAVYSERNLSVYDFIVLTLSNRLIWRCPTRLLVQHYDENVTANHLDVGVGTGYFLDRCRFPKASPRVALMDLNANSLNYASRRIARYGPETYLRNVLQPIEFEMPKFDSIGVNYLLHCLPGSIDEKAVALDHLCSLANPGAVVFGSTLVQGDVRRGWFARRLMALYNRKGIFSNANDTYAGLKRSLEQRLTNVTTQVIGCCVLFSGRVRQ